MDIRYSSHKDHVKLLDTENIRKYFLIDTLFEKGRVHMVYSHMDRIIAGGVCPVEEKLELTVTKELGVDFFLQRREMGIINIGPRGAVLVDGEEYVLEEKECLYVGMGAREVAFKSSDSDSPSKFYFTSTPAHFAYPHARLSLKDARRVDLGSPDTANVRTIHQFIHPDVVKSCQLVMGFTVLAPHSVWNTMPCHTHDRRMEVYFYLDMPENSVVFHLFGEPGETRHIVVRNEQAVISPSWSIHAGVGTTSYSFVWAMCGENQTFTDMDDVPMSALR
jgi:4-deoxy-L-threo-5-hexosulose-uronate ketol-isomerase